MTTFGEVVARASDLQPDDVEHLRRLISSWGMVADLCFADLLLVLRTSDGAFLVAAQVRPTTSQTVYQDDLVGREVPTAGRPQLEDAWASGNIVEGQHRALNSERALRVEYIPVRRDGRVLAVLTRELPLDTVRRPGRLERTYLEIFDRLAAMISNGTFPAAAADDDLEESPRVGDGVLVLDRQRVVEYASPNAMSALHRMGTLVNAEGRRLDELGLATPTVEASLRSGRPAVDEVEHSIGADRHDRVIVQLRSIPLVDDRTTIGALVLLRDISDLRRRDRLLLSKDAAIREVHHRVKNNLQTISALLNLQGRRTTSAEAREAIAQSVRRIRSIALVHETLSRDPSDTVAFADIVGPLVRMVEEGLASPERPVHITVDGDPGELPAEIATPLAVVLTELLQNAVEHAYPDGVTRKNGNIGVALRSDGRELAVIVRDDGVGFPAGFSAAASSSLGLSIVRTLVTSELRGAIAFRSDHGAVVELRIPLR